jgi:hypothetical protein
MAGAINLPFPGARKLAPDFNHHRKIGLLVLYEVHATEYMTGLGGSRVNAYCQTCQLTHVHPLSIKQTGKCTTGPDRFWFVPLPVRVETHAPILVPGRTYHPRAARCDGSNYGAARPLITPTTFGSGAALSARWFPFAFQRARYRSANRSLEGTTRRRFRSGRRISQPLSEFALFGLMDPAAERCDFAADS